MAKSIKKSFKYFIIGAGILITVAMMLSFIVRIPQIQTFIVKRITSHLSEKIKSSISVGSIDYRFFNRLNIKDILIKDKNYDTLLYSHDVTVGIGHIDTKGKLIQINRITLTDPVIALITDSAGEMNLIWYLNMLNSKNDTIQKKKSAVKIKELEVINGRFALIKRGAEKSRMPLDFSNLNLKGVDGIIEDIVNKNDTTTLHIGNLQFTEAGGLTVKRMSGNLLVSKTGIDFNSASVICDSSILNIDHVKIKAESPQSYKNFEKEVHIDIILDKSMLSTAEMKYFVPALKKMDVTVNLSGKVTGTVSELRGRNIEFSYGENTTLDCDFDFSGLPEIENSFMFLGINNLRTNAKDLEKIIKPGRAPLILPDILYKLGTISASGSFTGFTTDFVAYGKIRTDHGIISTDISLRPEDSNRFKITGLITGGSIALGELMENPEMIGNVSMRADVDGYAYSLKHFSGNLTGRIDSIELNRYKYRNIKLNGNFSENTWDGSINISEENIKMEILGMFNFSEKIPEFDFTLNLAKANLQKLNFDKNDTSSALSALLTANFKGSNIDNLDGEIKLLNSNLRKYNENLELYDFSIRTFAENEKPAINVRTDFVDADIRGYYNFADLGHAFKTAMARMMPSQFAFPPARETLIKNNFRFDVRFKNTDKINNFFRTGILLADKSALYGSVIPDSLLNIYLKTRSLSVNTSMFKDLSVDVNLIPSELNVRLRSSGFSILGQSELKGFSVDLETTPDNFIFGLNWDNKEEILNNGKFIAHGRFVKNDAESRATSLVIDIDSTDIYNRNNLWKISSSIIKLDSNAVNINKLAIKSKERYYLVDGKVSEDLSDTLKLEFKGIDISPLNYLAARKGQADMVPLSFRGRVDGDVLVTNIYKNPLLEVNLKVNKFSMLQSEFGDFSIVSEWNTEKKVADIRAFNNLEGKKMINISGYYDPGLKEINLTALADKMPVDALNPLLRIFASGITGTASGKINLKGPFQKLVLKGALMAENTSMKIDYLQAKYRLNDSIRFDKNAIIFKSVRLTDERGNPATLSGSVSHKYFKEYGADLMINMTDCMVMNTRQKDNEYFYGTAFASGVTTIKTGPSSLSFDISAKTGKNTRFFIPLNTSETVSDYSFITFVSPDTSAQANVIAPAVKNPAPAALGMDLNFDLEITPEAEVQLIFDSKLGDIMKGRGTGNLNIGMDAKNNFRISGDYIIEEGDYLFTLGNIFNKPFRVEEGGKISFNGDIDDAEIDIKAIYSLKASLYEILQDERFQERIPVECQINLSGKLFNPVVDFDIYLPMADEATRSYLKNVITTEEELSRQFLFLLLMNSFYADPSYASTVSTTTTTGTSAMAVTTTEMLSNQLSNWLSQISKDFEVGVTYRPGYKEVNSDEVQLALSTQMFDDKVRLNVNGNFDMSGASSSANNTEQLTGDFDLEYKLTDKIRFKVFNRFNNPYTGKQAPYTQGFGLFFNQEFDKLSDLFIKKLKSEGKKEEDTVVKD